MTFLFFAGIFHFTPPSLPLAYPPPPAPIPADQIRPKKHKKNRPGIAPGRRFIYSISIFQSGFEPAAKATKELNTRFHRLSTHAHPNKSGVIFAAFIWLYRDITKTICNPLRPCFIAYKRLYCVRGYKIAACAAVLFPCVYHALHPR